MRPETIDSREAHERLRADGAATYVDVRTVAEFAHGRPMGQAVNVPVHFIHPMTGERIPNRDFVAIVGALFAPTARLLVGAAADERAAAAADLLASAGFSALAVVAGGYSGWQRALLPTTRDNRDGVSYVSLLTRVRRANAVQAGPTSGHGSTEPPRRI